VLANDNVGCTKVALSQEGATLSVDGHAQVGDRERRHGGDTADLEVAHAPVGLNLPRCRRSSLGSTTAAGFE